MTDFILKLHPSILWASYFNHNRPLYSYKVWNLSKSLAIYFHICWPNTDIGSIQREKSRPNPKALWNIRTTADTSNQRHISSLSPLPRPSFSPILLFYLISLQSNFYHLLSLSLSLSLSLALAVSPSHRLFYLPHSPLTLHTFLNFVFVYLILCDFFLPLSLPILPLPISTMHILFPRPHLAHIPPLSLPPPLSLSLAFYLSFRHPFCATAQKDVWNETIMLLSRNKVELVNNFHTNVFYAFHLLILCTCEAQTK